MASATALTNGISVPAFVPSASSIALQFAHRGYVLDTGAIVAEGNASELMNNPDVKKAYLGG